MILSRIQRYDLNYFINYLNSTALLASQHQQLISIIIDILNESQTSENFKESIGSLFKLMGQKGPSKDIAFLIALHFSTPFAQGVLDIAFRDHGVVYPGLELDKDLKNRLIAQKFPPALPDINAACLAYAPAQLRLAKKYCNGIGVEKNKKLARDFFMLAFEKGIEDDESLYEYSMCFMNNKLADRYCYLWHTLMERNGTYSERAGSMLQLTLGGGNLSILKSFQQLLKEATPVDNPIKGGPITYESFGNPRAQAIVGFCYHIGLGVEQNIPMTIHFYKLSRDPNVFWDLLFCFIIELMNQSIDKKEVLEFYEKHLDSNSGFAFYQIPANLILARIYQVGIEGYIYSNPFKAYEYYTQAQSLITANTVHWDDWIEEKKLAEEGVALIQPLISCRHEVLNSLAPLGITLPLCNLTAEYCCNYAQPDPLKFSKNISEIEAEFSSAETKRNAEANSTLGMSMPRNAPLRLSGAIAVSQEVTSNLASRVEGVNGKILENLKRVAR